MRRSTLIMLATCVILGESSPAFGCGYGVDPLREFAQLDCIVVGYVVSIEPKNTLAFPYPRAANVSEYSVAVVRVYDPVMGVGEAKYVRVGFVLPQAPLGQVACFLLNRHYSDDFLTVRRHFPFPIAADEAEAFRQRMDGYRRLARLLADPIAGLTAKNQAERLHTVALLLHRYRTPRLRSDSEPEMRPMPARESRLMMEVLAQADWQDHQADFRNMPRRLFYSVGPTTATGWSPLGFANNEEFEAAAKRWLTSNAATHRIMGYVD